MAKYLKLIDKDENMNIGLKIGKVFKVVKEDNNFFYFTECQLCGWSKFRFEEVEKPFKVNEGDSVRSRQTNEVAIVGYVRKIDGEKYYPIMFNDGSSIIRNKKEILVEFYK